MKIVAYARVATKDQLDSDLKSHLCGGAEVHAEHSGNNDFESVNVRAEDLINNRSSAHDSDNF